MTRKLAVINRKGGIGKTTLAVNTAAAIASILNRKNGGDVLIIDIDPQGHVSKALGVDTRVNGKLACIGDFLAGDVEFDDVVFSADRSAEGDGDGLGIISRPNLYVIPATSRLTDTLRALDIRLYTTRGRKGVSMDNILSSMLGPYMENFDYVFLDCPPSIGALQYAVYEFVDEVIVPTKTAYLDSAGTAQHLEDIEEVIRNGLNVRVSWVVPTQFKANELVSQQIYQGIKEAYGRAVVDPIPKETAVEQSQAAGQRTIFEYALGAKIKSRAAIAIGELVLKIMKDKRK